MFSFNSNIAALNAQRQLAAGSSRLQTTLERLASGQRINRASDDAAGLAIASSLRSDSRVFSQAIRNINDAQSALSISQGSLGELSNVTIRMRELASQSANGTYSLKQRNALSGEANTLVDEFNRLVLTTQFNGVSLLDRGLHSMRIQAGYGLSGSLEVGLAESLHRNVGDGTFQAELSINSGVANALDMVTADFNNDGKLDLVTTAAVSSGAGILLGNGDGTFTAASGVTLGEGLAGSPALIAADFDGDGNIDLASANGSSSSVSIALGNGNGTFKIDTDFSTSTNARGLASGDFNRDGIVDLVVGSNNVIKIAYGTGNGSIGSFTNYTVATGANVSALAVGDLNGDSILDIAARSAGATSVGILLGNTDGTFGASTATDLGYAPYTLQISDVNNDGINDIVSASETSTALSVLLGTGGGNFAARTDYVGGSSANVRVKLADFNGDGFLDIIAGTTGSQSILMNNGNGTFGAKTDYTVTGGIQATVGDYNGDGATDFVTVSSGTGNTFMHLASPRQTSQIGYLNLNSVSGARAALDVVDQILNRINLELGSIGSAQSRLDISQSNLNAARENYEVAGSRIMDADIAMESSQMIRQQILQQTAASVLAQANQAPRLALSLLRFD